jgi:hypothetical protein
MGRCPQPADTLEMVLVEDIALLVCKKARLDRAQEAGGTGDSPAASGQFPDRRGGGVNRGYPVEKVHSNSPSCRVLIGWMLNREAANCHRRESAAPSTAGMCRRDSKLPRWRDKRMRFNRGLTRVWT